MPPSFRRRSIQSSGIASVKGTRRKSASTSTTIPLVQFTMATFALLLLTLLCNIIELSSLYAPSCSNEHDCYSENTHQHHQRKHYVAARDDPEYQLQDEDDLSQFDFSNLHDHLDCYQHATNQSKAMYTPDMYRHMKDQFTKLTGMEFDPLPTEQTVYHIGESEGAGRGVFASRRIVKGEIIPFDNSVHVVTFTDGMLWKEYIMSLPRTMGCDVLEW